MIVILLEVVVFVALVATVAGLLFYVVTRHTRVGTALRQAQNRRLIDREAELTCSIHGPQREEEMVRLPDGSRLCPQCYKEAVHG